MATIHCERCGVIGKPLIHGVCGDVLGCAKRGVNSLELRNEYEESALGGSVSQTGIELENVVRSFWRKGSMPPQTCADRERLYTAVTEYVDARIKWDEHRTQIQVAMSPATEPQLRFLADLRETIGFSEDAANTVLNLSKKQAGLMIETLLAIGVPKTHCAATTKKGKRCRNPRKYKNNDSRLCGIHMNEYRFANESPDSGA